MCIFCPLSLDLWHEILKTQNEANERVQGSALWDLEQYFKHGVGMVAVSKRTSGVVMCGHWICCQLGASGVLGEHLTRHGDLAVQPDQAAVD